MTKTKITIGNRVYHNPPAMILAIIVAVFVGLAILTYWLVGFIIPNQTARVFVSCILFCVLFVRIKFK